MCTRDRCVSAVHWWADPGKSDRHLYVAWAPADLPGKAIYHQKPPILDILVRKN